MKKVMYTNCRINN